MISPPNPPPPLNGNNDLTLDEQDEFWMQQAFELAHQAELIGEVPVGAILVQNNQIIAQGYNQSITQHDPTAHAEMIAIRQAGQQIQNYRLTNLTLYVTLEPCPMCAMAMIHARIKRVVYGTPDLKTGAIHSNFQLTNSSVANHYIETTSGVLQPQCAHQLSAFFKRRRAEKKYKRPLHECGLNKNEKDY